MLLVILIILLSLGTASFFAYQNVQLKNQISQITPTPSPAVVPSDSRETKEGTADWKTYTNEKLGFELKYPESYALLKEIPNITFGFGIGTEQPYPYLTISRDLTDYSVYKDCTANSTTPCLNGTKWNQSIGIMDTFLDGAPAKSIYFTKGVDGDYHIIQITNPIKLQLEMHIAGGKLDQTFTQILSTFKFTESNNLTGDCTYKGKSYSNGEHFPDDDECNTCYCNSNKVSCTIMNCHIPIDSTH